MRESENAPRIAEDETATGGKVWRTVVFEQTSEEGSIWSATVNVRVADDTDSRAELEMRARRAAISFVQRIAAEVKVA